MPSTLYSILYTLYSILYTLYSISYTLNPNPEQPLTQVPNTLKKSTRPPTRPMAEEGARGPPRDGPPRGDRPGGDRPGGGGRGGGFGDRPPREGGREGYRSERPAGGGFGRGGGGDKGGAPGGFAPQFS